jgi:hypothetical protein
LSDNRGAFWYRRRGVNVMDLNIALDRVIERSVAFYHWTMWCAFSVIADLYASQLITQNMVLGVVAVAQDTRYLSP